MSSSEPVSNGSDTERDSGLVRALGVREIAFNTVNLVVGASIFVLPAAAAKLLGPSAIVAYLVCAVTIGVVALCFAEAGSRVSATGGVYAYAETAFGSFFGYLTGVITWFGSFMIGSAAVAVALVNAVGVLVPEAAGTTVHNTLLVVIYVTLAAINIRGVKTGARFVEGLTVIKLAPLFLLIVVGCFSIDVSNLKWVSVPTANQVADGSLLLIFVFMGMESAVTPGGEIRDPARTVPRSILLALVLITVLYIAIQLVAQGVLGPALAEHADAPLAATAEKVLGGPGRLMLLAAAILSSFGYLAGDMLTSPRLLYAFGRDGHLPGAFTRVHARYRTPHIAIVVHTAAALGFALSGTFTKLVVLSAVSTLLIYLICAISVLALRMRNIRTAAAPFIIPGGPVVPVLACGVIAWLLSRSKSDEFIALALMLGVALVLYFLRRPINRAFGAVADIVLRAPRATLAAIGVLAGLAVAVYMWNPGGSPMSGVTGRLFGWQYIVVPGPQMEPALPAGSKVRICFDTFRARQPQRGEIVVFHHPKDESSLRLKRVAEAAGIAFHDESSGFFLKRVAAVAGEVMEIRDGAVYVDGAGPLEWFHADGASVSEYSRTLAAVTVPPGHLYALGDNLEQSSDSRRFGPIPTASVAGGLCNK